MIVKGVKRHQTQRRRNKDALFLFAFLVFIIAKDTVLIINMSMIEKGINNGYLYHKSDSNPVRIIPGS